MPQNTPRGYTYPLYTDPANFPAQIQDFATDVDTDVQAQVARINTAFAAPSVRVSATANQSIPNATLTAVTFATEDYDNAAMGNLGVNNDRITFTSTGIYLVQGWVRFASLNANGRYLELELAGTAVARENRASGSDQIELTISYLHQVSVVSTIARLRVVQDSGGALNINNRALTATKVAT
jgi:hypothetical protein